MRALATAVGALLWFSTPAAEPGRIQFVFTSDAHYGLTRPAFRGGRDVDAHIVNAAMVARINSLPAATFPKDGGIGSSGPIGAFDFVVEGGDIANRSELTELGQIQPASTSWAQFAHDYIEGLALTDAGGRRTPLYVVPGNHDASNAVGFYRPLTPATDSSSMVAIFNLMMHPVVPRTTATYRYPADKVLASTNLGGVHFVFLNVWPDSSSRVWLARDLRAVSPSTPVFLFTHDQPDAEAKHFTNPNGRRDINDVDRFENLLTDRFRDGPTIDDASRIEQRELEQFLRRHPNVSAWFHGNSNWNQFYEWTGPDHTIALHTFRVDSPMKGAVSAVDETRLSFHVATIDLARGTMTVRECLWNQEPLQPGSPLGWGGSVTVALAKPPRLRRDITFR